MTTDGTMAHLQFKEWTLVEVDKDGNPIGSKLAESESEHWARARGTHTLAFGIQFAAAYTLDHYFSSLFIFQKRC
jgi:hypothetical protein